MVFSWLRNHRRSNKASSTTQRPGRRSSRPHVEQLEARELLSASSDRFVGELFQDLLQRPVDPNGLTHFTTLLDRGQATRLDIAQAIVVSQESRGAIVRGLYGRFLGRPADPGGVTTFVGLLSSGSTVEDVAVSLLGSEEFFQNRGGGNNHVFLANLFRSVLGRDLDPTGEQAFLPRLERGEPRTSVAADVVRSTEGRERRVQGYYRDLLYRPADPGGLTLWVNALASGVRDEHIVASFAGSEEYWTRRVTTLLTANHERFVSGAYEDILLRMADPNGLSHFTSLLDRSVATRSQVAAQMLGSEEYREVVVRGLYNGLLRRAPDPEGLRIFVTFFRNGGTVEQVQALLAGSPEYFQNRSGGTVDGFLDALYQDLLMRPVDPQGREIFRQALASGTPRSQVAGDILASTEYREKLVQTFFQRFLRRPADNFGLSVFVPALGRGARQEEVIATLVGSPEYLGLSADRQAPTVVLVNLTPGLITNRNITVLGRVRDDLAGVATLQARVVRQQAIDLARADLASRLRVSPQEIRLLGSEARQFSDTCLDAPVPGTPLCPTVVTPGFSIRLQQGTTSYEYRTPSLEEPPFLTLVQFQGRNWAVTVPSTTPPFLGVSLDTAGNFSFPTGLPLDGTADGSYRVRLRATDQRGNTTNFDGFFTLDTQAPALILDAPVAGGKHTGTARLLGTLNEPTSRLVSSSATLDGQGLPFTMDAAGRFDQALSAGALASGAHQTVVEAWDLAGNRLHRLVPFEVGCNRSSAPP